MRKLDKVKQQINDICGNQFENNMMDDDFQKRIDIVNGWLQCEWMLGHVEMSDCEELRAYILERAMYYRNW